LARISGVDLPRDKRIEVALTYIYGIGRSSSRKILEDAGVDFNIRAGKLSDEQIANIRKSIESGYKVEGELRKEISMNIKMLMDAGTYRGLRHRRSLPVRGQRTHTNARTRKGPHSRIMVGKKKSKE
jgi:small subunit ribosomal protein S13